MREIARRLGVSLASASVWTRHVRPPMRTPAEPSGLAGATRSTTSVLCGHCRQMLPVSNFYVSRLGRQSWCKACRAEYMRGRGELHRQQTRAARERRRAKAREFLLELLRRGSCADCGLADPVVLEFDHLGSKTADVAKLVHEGYRLSRVKTEVASCQLVCVNCHRRRTAGRARTWRTDPGRVAAIDRPRRRRNLQFVLEHLRTASCIDCGDTDLVVLDFDHVAGKRGSVMVLALDEHSIASLEREIAACEIRCANCHRGRTVRQQPGHLRHHLL